MADLVESDDLALVRVEEPAPLLNSRNDALDCGGEIVAGHRISTPPRRPQRCLVDEVRQVGAGEARREGGNGFEVHVWRHLDLLGMHTKNGCATDPIGPIHQHLAVEAPRPQECWIEDLRPIGRCKQYNALARIKAVELDEQLIERLLLLVVSATEGANAPGPSHSVELVDEDEAGLGLAGLVEQIADARGADTDEHFHEIRAADGEEGHARFAGHCPSEQGLAGSCRAYEQHAFRDARSKAAVAPGIL
jgi:hypothetical protein